MRLLNYILLSTISTVLLAQVSGLQDQYTAGDPIQFSYTGNDQSLTMILTHSYGMHVMEGERNATETVFELPIPIAQKKGKIDFIITNGSEQLWKGATEIVAKTNGIHKMESYCGPKHLVVSKGDYSMITTTILDEFENPFPRRTPLVVSSLIDKQLTTKSIEMEDLIAFDRIYAPNRSGYGAVYAAYQSSSSQEFRLDFYANDPKSFNLIVNRQHGYADGLQLVELTTSTITDRLGNMMEDGTMVSFEVIDSGGQKTIAYASTINGQAKIELPAPSFPTSWSMQAEIAAYAKSQIEVLEFETAIQTIPIQVTKKELQIGPLKSYMGQLIKEGMLVKISIENERGVASYTLATELGIAALDYEKQLILPGSYDAIVEVGGLTKSLKLEVINE